MSNRQVDNYLSENKVDITYQVYRPYFIKIRNGVNDLYEFVDAFKYASPGDTIDYCGDLYVVLENNYNSIKRNLILLKDKSIAEDFNLTEDGIDGFEFAGSGLDCMCIDWFDKSNLQYIFSGCIVEHNLDLLTLCGKEPSFRYAKRMFSPITFDDFRKWNGRIPPYDVPFWTATAYTDYDDINNYFDGVGEAVVICSGGFARSYDSTDEVDVKGYFEVKYPS